MAKVKSLIAAALLVAGAWASPQAAATHQRPAAPSTVKRETAKPKLSDKELEAAIRLKFAKSKINEDKFTVRVQGGVAIIDGKTDVLQHKGVATRMSKTAGAVAVDNRVHVSDAAKAKAAGNLEEGRRRVQVKREDSRTERK